VKTLPMHLSSIAYNR